MEMDVKWRGKEEQEKKYRKKNSSSVSRRIDSESLTHSEEGQ